MATTPLSLRVTARPVVRPVDSDAVVWRCAELSDLDSIAALERAMALADHPNYTHPLEEVAEQLEHSVVDLERDSLVAVDVSGGDPGGGRVIAYGLVVMPASRATAVRSQIFNGGVHPEFRGRGIGRALLAWQESRALEQLASSNSKLPGRIVLAPDERAAATCRLAERFGFVASRWFVGQERDLREPIPRIRLEPGIRIVAYSSEWSEATRLVKNDAFRDHWGSQPADREEWESMLALPAASPEHSFLAVTDADEIAGLLLSEVSREDWPLQGFSSGYVELLGVPRPWRGKRIAAALLARALDSYRDAGFDRAVLDVDSDSPTGAVGLYARMGFTPTTRRVIYLKEF
jgi:mycothiol synthase